MEEDLVKRFGERLRSIRKEKGFSQEGFASFVGIDRSYYGQIERGTKNITILKIHAICSALGIQPGDLLNEKK